MKCPHCGMEVEPGEKKCPYCYGILECGDPDNCDDELEHGKKSSGGLKRLLIPALVLVLAAFTAFNVVRLTTGGSHRTPDTVVAKYDGVKLTNRELNYYYWNDYYYYANYGIFEEDVPLTEQQYDSNTTWHDFMVESALTSWRDMTDVVRVARSEGYELPEEYRSELASLDADLAESAEDNGFETIDEYLKWVYGEGSELESFRAFVENTYYMTAYSNDKYDELYERFAYASDPEPTVDVRHILFDGDAYDDPEAEARRVLALIEENPSEEYFAELAEEYSTDPGSSWDGGLYEGVWQGQMVSSFDAWCFDPARQPGDVGLVETDYGWHIMYFIGEGEPTTEMVTEDVYDQYYMWLEELITDEIDVSYNKIEIYPTYE